VGYVFRSKKKKKKKRMLVVFYGKRKKNMLCVLKNETYVEVIEGLAYPQFL
jgi:hypothetical protein